jgi:hypothetical protein
MTIRTTAAAATAAGAALFAGAPAHAESGRLVDFSTRLTSTSPGTPTGLADHILLHRADDPNGKPAPLRSAVFHAPAGVRFDTTAAPQCMASDAEVQARGSDACPPETELTVGSFTALTGFGPPVDPFNGDDHVFNGPGQFIEIVTANGTFASPGFDRLTIDGSTLTAHPPVSPGGPPDGETAIRSIDFEIPVVTNAGKALITTPPACPGDGLWRASATFAFADGTSETVGSTTPCATPAAGRTPSLSVSVTPRRVHVGRATRLHLRVRSAAPRCVAGARVHFAGRALHADSRGRAAMTTTLHRAGIRRVRASHAGCGRATARVRAMRNRVAVSELSATTGATRR